MTQNKELRLRIEGHTSAEGDASLNQKLSEERAQAAVDFLVNKEGIDASHLTAAGYGSSKPVSEIPKKIVVLSLKSRNDVTISSNRLIQRYDKIRK